MPKKHTYLDSFSGAFDLLVFIVKATFDGPYSGGSLGPSC